MMQQLVATLGLRATIDERLRLFKRHLPYHESDHVLNMTYNLMTGGTCLEDLELRRQDLNYSTPSARGGSPIRRRPGTSCDASRWRMSKC